MQSNLETCFFLGANSADGFYSVYDDFTEHVPAMLYILKGGPGCGKSTLMRTIASGMRAAGHSVESIRCSGDPDSLDAVYIPDLSVGYVDGTAPHVIEAHFPAASAQYLNLGKFYDAAAIQKSSTKIRRVTAAYKALYATAYQTIAAGTAVLALGRPALSPDVCQTMKRRAAGVISREMRGKSTKPASVRVRFLDALTCQGTVCCLDTVKNLAERIYVLDDDCGAAQQILDPIVQAACRIGQPVIRCLNHLEPARTAHVLVPGLSLAFMTQTTECPRMIPGAKHFRLDTLCEKDLSRAQRAKLRRLRRTGSGLLRDAAGVLAEAKQLHDELEALYNPHVDFDGVRALADLHLQTLLNSGIPDVL